MLEDVIVDRRWSEGGGDSRCLLLGENRSAQLEVEELGSWCGRDKGGGRWVGGLKVTGREGGKGRSVNGRETGGVQVSARYIQGVCGWFKEGRMS